MSISGIPKLFFLIILLDLAVTLMSKSFRQLFPHTFLVKPSRPLNHVLILLYVSEVRVILVVFVAPQFDITTALEKFRDAMREFQRILEELNQLHIVKIQFDIFPMGTVSK